MFRWPWQVEQAPTITTDRVTEGLTDQVVAERRPWMMEKLRGDLSDEKQRTRILLGLCGAYMPMNRAALLISLAEEALAKRGY